MIKTAIHAGVCGFTTTVTARSEDMQNVTLEITSTCDKIRGLAAALKIPSMRTRRSATALTGWFNARSARISRAAALAAWCPAASSNPCRWRAVSRSPPLPLSQ